MEAFIWKPIRAISSSGNFTSKSPSISFIALFTTSKIGSFSKINSWKTEFVIWILFFILYIAGFIWYKSPLYSISSRVKSVFTILLTLEIIFFIISSSFIQPLNELFFKLFIFIPIIKSVISINISVFISFLFKMFFKIFSIFLYSSVLIKNFFAVKSLLFS